MSDGTANYVNKEYGYAKLLWDFQKLDVPMRHLGGQGDSLIERRRKRRCGRLNQTLHRLAWLVLSGGQSHHSNQRPKISFTAMLQFS